jgi:hypothetical protein
LETLNHSYNLNNPQSDNTTIIKQPINPTQPTF